MSSTRARSLVSKFSWASTPFIIGAPMRVMSGPNLALAISKSGGLGFIGPGAKPADIHSDLATLRGLVKDAPPSSLPASFVSSKSLLPVGIGFQLWDGDVDSAAQAVKEYRPCAAWLFAPRDGQADLDTWTSRLREASPDTQIWIQIGTLQEALDILQGKTRPDVIVVQGAEAGGHGRANDGLGIITLFPEIADALGGDSSGIGLVAAGGIADGRGVAAALALGADGVVLGTRFLASTEARISKGYQQEVVRATDGAKSTTRTMLYNQLRGTTGWPEGYSPRGILNRSWHDHQAGVGFEELKRLYAEATKEGDAGWGPEGRLATYAGASIGLIHSVKDAGEIVSELRTEASDIIRRNYSRL
uniref:Nitronate monooxygenase domain-containing protein n=1 Tax=Bionectria ochroleuca TaxID=29856 RepID=A0A8H7NNT0_BIOOC